MSTWSTKPCANSCGNMPSSCPKRMVWIAAHPLDPRVAQSAHRDYESDELKPESGLLHTRLASNQHSQRVRMVVSLASPIEPPSTLAKKVAQGGVLPGEVLGAPCLELLQVLKLPLKSRE